MILRQCMMQCLQFSLLIGYVGFAYSADPLLRDYQEFAEPIKNDILPKLKLVKEKTEYTGKILNKRLAVVEDKIKNELGREAVDAFYKRIRPLYLEYINTSAASYENPENKKLVEKAQKLERNPDIQKRIRLDRLVHAQDIILSDLNTQKNLLNKVNVRLENPDAYLASMNQKTYTEPGNIPVRDPMPRLLDNLEYYEKELKDVGNDPIENWFDENGQGYLGRRTISQIPFISDMFDRTVQYSMEHIDDVLRREHQIPLESVYKRLGLGLVNKPGGPMFSPVEPTFYGRLASWWRATSNWISQAVNKFRTAQPYNRTPITPGFVQPRITVKPIENINVHDQWKPSKPLHPGDIYNPADYE